MCASCFGRVHEPEKVPLPPEGGRGFANGRGALAVFGRTVDSIDFFGGHLALLGASPIIGQWENMRPAHGRPPGLPVRRAHI